MTKRSVANSTAIPQPIPDLHALSEQLQIPVHILRWVDQHLGAVTRLNARLRQFRDGFERIGVDARRYECEWRDREPHTFQPIDPETIARFETPCREHGIDPQTVYDALHITEWDILPRPYWP